MMNDTKRAKEQYPSIEYIMKSQSSSNGWISTSRTTTVSSPNTTVTTEALPMDWTRMKRKRCDDDECCDDPVNCQLRNRRTSSSALPLKKKKGFSRPRRPSSFYSLGKLIVDCCHCGAPTILAETQNDYNNNAWTTNANNDTSPAGVSVLVKLTVLLAFDALPSMR
jgi:hypothetical protein